MTREEQWLKESIENYIFAYTGKRAKISDADAQHFTACAKSYLNLCKPSLPSNLDEAAEEIASDIAPKYPDIGWDECFEKIKDGIKAGAEWVTGQGWIDDGSMPPEMKQESDTLQGHREWTESEPVLAWDSLYGCRVDWTRNGKWMSEQTGGYTGQVCHGIIAWRPIPKYKDNNNQAKA